MHLVSRFVVEVVDEHGHRSNWSSFDSAQDAALSYVLKLEVWPVDSGHDVRILDLKADPDGLILASSQGNGVRDDDFASRIAQEQARLAREG